MDKNAIKKYAVWARRELIERVSQRAMIYGITAKDAGDPNAESVNGHLLSQAEKRQRQALIRNIKEKGYEQVMEEVAYTWFNRFAALRFMEVNGYLPSHIRVFTNDAGEFKPQILAEAIHLELDGLDMNKVYELESANKSEELFKYLLIVQCNALNSILPGMFQRIEDSAYEEATVPICCYVLENGKSESEGLYFKLSAFTGGMEVQKEKLLAAISDRNCGYYFERDIEMFKAIPGHPFAFWGTPNETAVFSKCKLLSDIANPRQGLITGNVNLFVRKWHECSAANLNLCSKPSDVNRKGKWFPYCNGGAYRKWYGNNDDVVNWYNDGEEVKGFVDEKGKQRSRPQNQQHYYHEGGTWSAISR